jgi:4-alpha-glucanotransferase
MTSPKLHQLAKLVGVADAWRDVNGNHQVVDDDCLKAVLGALGFSAETEGQIDLALASLRLENQSSIPKLLTVDVGMSISCPGLSGRYMLRLESGEVQEGILTDQLVPGIDQPGYHFLEIDGREIEIAVAPARAHTISDISRGRKMWGIAVQLYGIRRTLDGGIGDFAGLEEFAVAAARNGADAVAISPVHAQFFNDLSRFGPYAPSNRAALNVLHIAEPSGFDDDGEFVNWQQASAAKMAALRRTFETFQDYERLSAFRAKASAGLELHAVFEALQSHLKEQAGLSNDWRTWPSIYHDPAGDAVETFRREHQREILFHIYLQFRAEQALAAAQDAARRAGMKIGLISDLAVGTDPAGSHSWSRQGEILSGLEIGAPPDAINREGQCWGIATFSPRGLQASGFSAFIEMLRQAMKYSGGVRIDHIMGLSRLWVVPRGLQATEGAYLQMPMADMLRLVALESYRHQAVILGEDLGTLPDGFQSRLEQRGISGLRVMWFEKNGARFSAPSGWSDSAVAMTSTHDLPTVAGWWEGRDIQWRDRLGMAGDDAPTRDAEKQALWAAFQDSGAADHGVPPPDDTAVVVDAACKHLAMAACPLALIPVEDLLALKEQPNLPGTIDQHPNWRRRLPDTSSEIFERPDVLSRISAINAARRN